jgi:beta-glucosidase
VSKENFPNNFVWGTATSAYQIEGAAAEDGRGPSIWDTFSHTPGKTLNGDTGDVACDHYHRYAEDLDLITKMGLNAYRFSIAWPRVQPLGQGAWNEKGLAFYDRLVDGMLERGIAPHATLYHWDLPQALQDKGGWLNRDTAQRFADYAVGVANRLGDRVETICTHNEPWCTAYLGHHIGQFAPGMRDPAAALQAAHHLLLSHGMALQAMRATGCKVPLGIVLNQSSATPATNSAADAALAQREYARFVRWYMDPIFLKQYPADAEMEFQPTVAENDFEIIAQPLDFLGVNYYTRIWASAERPPRAAPKLLGETDMGWEIYPEGLTELLVRLHRDYKLPPVYITENGMANADEIVNGRVMDSQRIEYLSQHLNAISKAMQAGVNVQGFFYWSLLDNYEWNSGYAKRFGLVHVDYATQQRTLKESAHWYRDFVTRQRQAKAA